MAQVISNTALLKCSLGVTPAPLIVLPANRTLSAGNPLATIKDAAPFLNIPPFGMCAACPAPCPCIPKTVMWQANGKKTINGGMPAINKDSKLMCMMGGTIEVIMPGQVKVNQ